MTIASLENLRNRAAKRSESQARAAHSLPCRQMPRIAGTRVVSIAIDSGACPDIAISDADAWVLLADGLLYECDDGLHDLHIDTHRLWTGEDVARILCAADKQARAGDRQ